MLHDTECPTQPFGAGSGAADAPLGTEYDLGESRPALTVRMPTHCDERLAQNTETQWERQPKWKAGSEPLAGEHCMTPELDS